MFKDLRVHVVRDKNYEETQQQQNFGSHLFLKRGGGNEKSQLTNMFSGMLYLMKARRSE